MINPSSPFWRERPLSVPEWELLVSLADAHAASARRDNVSTHAVAGAALGSGDYTKAMAAPLLTLGGLHAPLLQAHAFLSLDDPAAEVEGILARGLRVPGWGQSFVKGQPDPAWDAVAEILGDTESGLRIDLKMAKITKALGRAGKAVFPNPGGYTAAAALILEMPASVAPYLFVEGRLEVWSQQFMFHGRSNLLWNPNDYASPSNSARSED